MGSGIFTRKAGELIFYNKIQQSSIDFTRLNIIKRSNRITKEIIIIGIREITQFGIILRHTDKVNDLTHEQTEKGKRKREEKIGKERANKTARVKWGRGK